MKSEETKTLLSQNLGYELEKLKNEQKPDELFKYISLVYEKENNLVNYLPEEGLIFIDEIRRVQEMSDSLDREEADWYTALLEEGKIIHDLTVAHSLHDALQKSSRSIVYLSLFLRHVPNTNPQNIINISCKQMQNFHGQMHVLKTELERWKKGNFAVIFLGADKKRMEHLERVLGDYGVETVTLPAKGQILPGTVQIAKDLHTGLNFRFKVAVITEKLFNKKRRGRTGKTSSRNG